VAGRLDGDAGTAIAAQVAREVEQEVAGARRSEEGAFASSCSRNGAGNSGPTS
jgi:hypothetical protein